MSVAAPITIVEAFALAGFKNAIPVASSPTPGAASYNDGFPAVCFAPLASGGIPPAGKDMNGILFEMSGNLAWLQGGGHYAYSAGFVTANIGYAVGAILQSSASPYLYWLNTVADNATDPDGGGPAGWLGIVASRSGYLLRVPAAGATNNYAPAGFNPSVGVLDLNPTGGAAVLTGLAGGVDDQVVVVTNVHAANSVTLNALDGGSVAGNQFRAPANIVLAQYQSVTLQKSSGAGLWLVTSKNF